MDQEGSAVDTTSSNETVGSINLFPNDLLILILSRLPLKAAARTSILSRRWRHLWTHTARLDFDALDAETSWSDSWFIPEIDVEEYINWVDRVLAASKTPFLDRFEIRFFLDSLPSEKIDSWLKFAVERRVRELKLVLFLEYDHMYSRYEFPRFGFATTLTSLHLEYIDIMPNDLNYLLTNCALLEDLYLSSWSMLGDIEISTGRPLRLRRLTLAFFLLNAFSVSDPTPELVSFSYIEGVEWLHFKSAPKLIDLSIDNLPARLYSHPLMQLFPQLHSLSILLPEPLQLEKTTNAELLLPELNRLKHLTLKIDELDSDPRLYGLTLLIKKAPSLESLSLKVQWRLASNPLKARRFCKYSHPCLRVVALRGFIGSDDHMNIALYLLNIASSPEKLVIDLRDINDDNSYGFIYDHELPHIMDRALELREVMAAETQLVVKSVDTSKVVS